MKAQDSSSFRRVHTLTVSMHISTLKFKAQKGIIEVLKKLSYLILQWNSQHDWECVKCGKSGDFDEIERKLFIKDVKSKECPRCGIETLVNIRVWNERNKIIRRF